MFDVPDWATRIDFCNQSLSWMPTDSEESFDRNMKNKKWKKILTNKGYTKTSISYDYNKYGFRCPEFNDVGNNIISIGCSFTEGIGLRNDEVWGSVLAKELNVPHYNLGVGGGSPFYCLNMLETWIPLLRPKYVFCLMPHPYRQGAIGPFHHGKEIVRQIHSSSFEDLATHETPRTRLIVSARSKSSYGAWFKNLIHCPEENIQALVRMNSNQLDYLANKYSVPIYYESFTENGLPCGYLLNDDWDWARDCAHTGSNYHKGFASVMLEKLNE